MRYACGGSRSSPLARRAVKRSTGLWAPAAVIIAASVTASIGGVIAPGLGISAEALFRSAARLPRVEIARPARVIGKTTVSAIQSGLFHGYVGLIDGLLVRLLEEMGGAARVLATGGLSELIAEASEHVDEAVPQLTLDGLRLIHERN